MKKFITAILAMLVMLPAVAQNKKSGRNFEIAKNLDIFNTIYRELDMFYVDTLEAEKLIRVGIDAMLNELDPYTEYYSEEEMDKLKMMTTGKYGGIGSIIRMRKDSTVIIMEPYAGMPAAEAGLKVGDVMLRIDDTDLTGKAVSEVSNMLRGEPGTTFLLRIQRQGEKKPRDFKITRQNIKIPAMPYYGMCDGIGYINLSDFTRDCSQDIRKAVISLKEKGAQGIVLDLRNNGGGLLVEAVDIINLFVPKGLDIVEMRGKARSSNNTYRTTSAPLDTIIPIAVLVNGNTASAAEIVAGSLQDLDRAVVLGSRSFGKGLVQSPRDLPYNGSIKLTTSKYYIPSGRCIQAIDYKHRRNATDNSDGHVPDSLTKVFHTANGREVRDGGGIKPDVEVKHDTMPNIMFYLANDDVLVDFGTKYCRTHPTIPAVKDFTITDEDFEDFKKMIIESGFKYDRLSDKRLKDLKKMAEFEGYLDEAKEEFDALEKKLEHNLERDLNNFKKDIKKLMAQEIIKRYYFQAGVIEEQIKDDEDVMRAVEIIKNKEEYNKILGE